MTGGTLTVGLRWEDGGFNATGGTVILNGPIDITVTSGDASAFNHVQIGDGLSTPTVALNSNLTIHGNLLIKSWRHSMAAPLPSIWLAIGWMRGNGFTPGSSTALPAPLIMWTK